jgi:hypothetical protein
MTDLRQAAQQALEALETYKGFIDDAHIIEGQWHWIDGSDNAITALRKALEQPEQVDCPRCGHVCSQRPWVGLTDDERNSLWRNNGHTSLMKGIEDKLKERNT